MPITNQEELDTEATHLMMFAEVLIKFAQACAKADTELAVAFNADLIRLYSEAAQR